MPKLKTKKKIQSFGEGIEYILKAYNIEVPEDMQEKFREDITKFHNNFNAPKVPTPWFSELVSHYFQYYENLIGERPAFLHVEPRALKEISNVLKSRYLHKNPNGIWDCEAAIAQHEIFYDWCCTLPFYHQNFSISLLYTSFDKITSQLASQRNRQKEIDDKIVAD